MTEIVADKTVEVVKNAIETADGALDLYNKYLDQVIPWQTFDETIKELSRFKQEYSQAASVLVGDIKTLLMDSQDKYFEATQTVYEWCGVATQLLAAYILLFDEYNEKKASAQKDILIKVLDDGITKLNEAQKSLPSTSSSPAVAASTRTSACALSRRSPARTSSSSTRSRAASSRRSTSRRSRRVCARRLRRARSRASRS